MTENEVSDPLAWAHNIHVGAVIFVFGYVTRPTQNILREELKRGNVTFQDDNGKSISLIQLCLQGDKDGASKLKVTNHRIVLFV